MAFAEVQAQWHRLATVTPYDQMMHHHLLADGGFSRNPYTNAMPTHGYMVGIHPENGGVEHTHSLSELIPEHIANHREEAASQLRDHRNFQGGWATSDGRAVLDVSRNIQDRNEAITEGHRNHQEAIWDLKNNSEISLPKRTA